MDAQLRRGILDVAVLSVLSRSDSYGYKIVSDLSKTITITESTLYPILKRLELNKLVITYDSNYQGRTRKYYQITANGKRRIQEFLLDCNELISVVDYIRRGTL